MTEVWAEGAKKEWFKAGVIMWSREHKVLVIRIGSGDSAQFYITNAYDVQSLINGTQPEAEVLRHRKGE